MSLFTINCRVIVRPPAVARKPRLPARPEVVIPTDLLYACFRDLFPAERMFVFGGQRNGHIVQTTSLIDVTGEDASLVRVHASAERLRQALLDFDRAGAHFAVWMHSHPGRGLLATHPSSIDLNQDRDLRLHHSLQLVGIIAVADGWLRLFGTAIDEDAVDIRFQGNGIERHPEEHHAYRLNLS